MKWPIDWRWRGAGKGIWLLIFLYYVFLEIHCLSIIGRVLDDLKKFWIFTTYALFTFDPNWIVLATSYMRIPEEKWKYVPTHISSSPVPASAHALIIGFPFVAEGKGHEMIILVRLSVERTVLDNFWLDLYVVFTKPYEKRQLLFQSHYNSGFRWVNGVILFFFLFFFFLYYFFTPRWLYSICKDFLTVCSVDIICDIALLHNTLKLQAGSQQ